nr:MAG TPA: hypothetical protein [Caudoviricetes sp.]
MPPVGAHDCKFHYGIYGNVSERSRPFPTEQNLRPCFNSYFLTPKATPHNSRLAA